MVVVTVERAAVSAVVGVVVVAVVLVLLMLAVCGESNNGSG